MNEPEAEKQSREAVFVGFLFLGISALTKVSYNHVFPFLSFIDLGVIWFSEKLFTSFEVYLLKTCHFTES